MADVLADFMAGKTTRQVASVLLKSIGMDDKSIEAILTDAEDGSIDDPMPLTEAERKTLGKPFRTPNGPKKFSVYVKNQKGNVVKVNFGDPKMRIKRQDSGSRRGFRARHNCQDPGPRWKARYWSCRFWSRPSVTKLLKESFSGEYTWDGRTFVSEAWLHRVNPALLEVRCPTGKGGGIDNSCKRKNKKPVNPKVLDWAKKRFKDETKAQNFAEWFGDSKVVDSDGNPLVFYHGTGGDFDAFEKSSVKSNYDQSFGFHFASDPEEASRYAPDLELGEKPGGKVFQVYIKVSNPLIRDTGDQEPSMHVDLDRADIIKKIVDSRKTDNPYDGVIAISSDGRKNVVAFDPAQIKSATGNKGTFNPDSNKINESFQEAKDGDGDGLIDDGKPTQRAAPKKQSKNKSSTLATKVKIEGNLPTEPPSGNDLDSIARKFVDDGIKYNKLTAKTLKVKANGKTKSLSLYGVARDENWQPVFFADKANNYYQKSGDDIVPLQGSIEDVRKARFEQGKRAALNSFEFQQKFNKRTYDLANEIADAGYSVRINVPDDSTSRYIYVDVPGREKEFKIRIADHAQPGYSAGGKKVNLGGFSKELGKRHEASDISIDPTTGSTLKDALDAVKSLGSKQDSLQEAKDGDGDGLIDDGKPTQRAAPPKEKKAYGKKAPGLKDATALSLMSFSELEKFERSVRMNRIRMKSEDYVTQMKDVALTRWQKHKEHPEYVRLTGLMERAAAGETFDEVQGSGMSAAEYFSSKRAEFKLSASEEFFKANRAKHIAEHAKGVRNALKDKREVPDDILREYVQSDWMPKDIRDRLLSSSEKDAEPPKPDKEPKKEVKGKEDEGLKIEKAKPALQNETQERFYRREIDSFTTAESQNEARQRIKTLANDSEIGGLSEKMGAIGGARQAEAKKLQTEREDLVWKARAERDEDQSVIEKMIESNAPESEIKAKEAQKRQSYQEKINAAFIVFENKKRDLKEKGLKDIVSELSVPEDQRLDLSTKVSFKKQKRKTQSGVDVSAEEMNQRVDAAREMISKITAKRPGLTSAEVQIEIDPKNKRAFYSLARKTVVVGPTSGVSTIAHEIGHALEIQEQGQTTRSKSWLAVANEGGTVKTIGRNSKRIGVRSEVYYANKNLAEHAQYARKLYNSEATELVSQGFSRLIDDPAELVADDAHFRFFMGWLKGK
jgi:hypothetical protein